MVTDRVYGWFGRRRWWHMVVVGMLTGALLGFVSRHLPWYGNVPIVVLILLTMVFVLRMKRDIEKDEREFQAEVRKLLQEFDGRDGREER